MLLKLLIYIVFVLGLILVISRFKSFKSYLFLDDLKLLYEDWDLYIGHSQMGDNLSLPKNNFKNYTMISNILKSLELNYGQNMKEQWHLLRNRLLDDFKSEVRSRKVVLNTIYQSFFISTFVWGFILLFKSQMNLEFKVYFYISIASTQLVGIISLVTFQTLLSKHFFKSLNKWQSQLIQLLELHRAGVPLGLIGEKLDLNSLKVTHDVKSIVRRIKKALTKYSQFGVSIEEELSNALEEINFLKKQKMDKFEQLMNISKLVNIVLFQVTCYFFFLYKMCFLLLSN